MAVEFHLPDLGENIEAGVVINLLVAVGDSLSEDQAVIELETDKAVIEVPSSVSGRIEAIHVSQGDQVSVGQVILSVESAASVAVAAQDPPPAAAQSAAPGAAGPIEVFLPEVGEGTDGGDVIAILVSPGDRVEVEQGLIELELDKGVVEVPSAAAGTVVELHVAKGDRATVGQLVATLQGTSAAPSPAPSSSAPAAAAPASSGPAGASAVVPGAVAPAPSPAAAPAVVGVRKLVPAAPSVRRLAREIGVDVSAVPGTGPGGRISEADVKAHSKAVHEERAAAPAGGPLAVHALPDFAKWGEIEREAMSNVRRLTAEHMVRAWTTIPQVTGFDKADITELEVWRKKYGKKAEAAGGKLTPTAIVLKIAAAALVKFPGFNASLDAAANEIIYKKYCHIGVAVDTPRGLLVPVVRDVDQKNMIELAVELGEMADRARKGKIGVDEMQGGCFTISNLGGIGGTAFTPIVNPPEVAILGVARGGQEAVFVDGQFVPRLMMPLSLSYDHRVIDGANGARFLRWICEALENPFLIALEG